MIDNVRSSLEVVMTQLESARQGQITPEMQRVAEKRKTSLPSLIRDEIIRRPPDHPANINHLKYRLDPWVSDRRQLQDQRQHR